MVHWSNESRKRDLLQALDLGIKQCREMILTQQRENIQEDFPGILTKQEDGG